MVSNINIKDKVIDFLKKNKKDNTNTIATIFRKIKPDDRLQDSSDDYAYTIDHSSNSLMQIENLQGSEKFVLNQERISIKQGKS